MTTDITRTPSRRAICALTFGTAFLLSLTGCDSDGKNQQTGMGGAGGSVSGNTPPMGASALEAWLATGTYRQWRCEPAVHAARSPSPHGFNRICSNSAISTNAGGTSSWPQGAAAVKELHADEAGTTPVGYAVYLKTASDSEGGSNWYWYERVPLADPAPHDSEGVVADGLGNAGPPMQICVGCHGPAGSDAAHTPTPGGRDLVYTPVM